MGHGYLSDPVRSRRKPERKKGKKDKKDGSKSKHVHRSKDSHEVHRKRRGCNCGRGYF